MQLLDRQWAISHSIQGHTCVRKKRDYRATTWCFLNDRSEKRHPSHSRKNIKTFLLLSNWKTLLFNRRVILSSKGFSVTGKEQPRDDFSFSSRASPTIKQWFSFLAGGAFFSVRVGFGGDLSKQGQSTQRWETAIRNSLLLVPQIM